MRTFTPSAQRALRELGESIRIARVRRRIRQKDMAMRMGVSIVSLRALENGHAGVCIGTLAMALLVLGNLSQLGELSDVAKDDIAMLLEIEALPKRVRANQLRPSAIDK